MKERITPLDKKFLIVDTETTNSLEYPFVYDLGYAVIDNIGDVYEIGSYVNADIFLDKDLMASAFFLDKVPKYWEEIQKGERFLRKWKRIKKVVREVMETWDIKDVIAHNAIFDYRSTAYTQRYLTCSRYRYFFPFGTHFIDTLKMAKAVFAEDEQFQKWANDNGYLTKQGHAQYKAEILYRYITNDNNFVEAHTALEDVMIEKEIFAECLRRNPELDGYLW